MGIIERRQARKRRVGKKKRKAPKKRKNYDNPWRDLEKFLEIAGDPAVVKDAFQMTKVQYRLPLI